MKKLGEKTKALSQQHNTDAHTTQRTTFDCNRFKRKKKRSHTNTLHDGRAFFVHSSRVRAKNI